ncbi:MAG: hypothetical protein ACI8QS_001150 [Planctomycetota bacterium]|jgi:hypothetical protein
MILPLLLGALTGALVPSFEASTHEAPAAVVFESGHALSGLSVLQDDEEEKPDKRPEVKSLIELFKAHVKQRGKEDDEAVGVIDQLVKEFAESGPKDQKAIIDALEKCFKEKRKALEDGSPDNRLFMAAAVSMGYMGEAAAKPLSKLVDHKSLRDDLDLQRRIILSLGKTESEKYVKVLMDTLKHHEPRMQAYAAEALASFAGHALDLRKEVFQEVLKMMMGVRSTVDTDTQGTNTVAQDRWAVISGPMISTLRSLSGQEIRDAHEWQAWWNNNKKEEWGTK